MKVIIAARLSQLQKDGRAGLGLDTQDTRSRGWCEREGHEVITDPIADTKSGTVAPWDRRHLRPWVTKPELMTQYEGIVAYRNDRLSRGVWADEARIRLWAEEHGKTLMIVDGPQWPPRHDGDKWSWEAQASQARKEWESDRERSMRAQAELRDRGVLVGRVPFGYSSAGPKYDRRMVPTAQGSRYVPEAYTRIADGQTLPAVSAWLSAETGHTFHPRSVAKLIRNPAYAGQRKDASGKVIHQCPPLVSGDLWRRANANLDARPSARRGQRNDLDPAGAAVLSGIAYCGNPDCTAGPDSPMYKVTCGSGSQPRVAYYRCSGRGATRKGCGCMVPLAAADKLLDRGMALLSRQVMVPVFHPATGHQVALDDITQALRDLPAQGLDDDAEDAERARLRAERKRLADLPATPAWTEWVESGETYAQRWTRLDQAGRRAWLREAGIPVYLAKPGAGVVSDDEDDEAGGLAYVFTDEHAQIWFPLTAEER